MVGYLEDYQHGVLYHWKASGDLWVSLTGSIVGYWTGGLANVLFRWIHDVDILRLTPLGAIYCYNTVTDQAIWSTIKSVGLVRTLLHAVYYTWMVSTTAAAEFQAIELIL
jgi:hypothetical protein